MNRTSRPAIVLVTLAVFVAGCGGGGVSSSHTSSTPVVPVVAPTTNLGLPNVTPVPMPSTTPFSTPTPIEIVTPVATPTP